MAIFGVAPLSSLGAIPRPADSLQRRQVSGASRPFFRPARAASPALLFGARPPPAVTITEAVVAIDAARTDAGGIVGGRGASRPCCESHRAPSATTNLLLMVWSHQTKPDSFADLTWGFAWRFRTKSSKAPAHFHSSPANLCLRLVRTLSDHYSAPGPFRRRLYPLMRLTPDQSHPDSPRNSSVERWAGRGRVWVHGH